MPSLSREVLKWLQGLDLPFSIKDPKRDFSNGYLIAEIISRYYPSGPIKPVNVPNASSTKTKKENWAFINRVALSKFDIDVPQEVIDRVIAGDNDAVVVMVNTIYTFLTKRTPPSPPARPPPVERQTIRGVKPILAAKRSLAEPEPESQTSQPGSRRMMRPSGSTLATGRQMALSDAGTVRSSLGPGQSTGNVKPVFEIGKTQSLKTMKSGVPAANVAATHPSGGVRSVFDILNGSVKTVLEADDSSAVRDLLRTFDPRKDIAASFANDMERVPPRVFATVINHMRSKSVYVSDSCVSNTREFWLLFSAFIRGYYALPVGSEAYNVLRSFIQDVIAAIRDHDVAVSHLLLLHYALPLALPLVASHKRLLAHLLADICGLLAPDDIPTHLAVVRAVQEGLPDQTTRAVAELAGTLLPQVPASTPYLPDLTDLYLYYAVVGSGNPDGIVRADSIRIAAHCAALDPEAVESTLDGMSELCHDQWWDVPVTLAALAVEAYLGNDSAVGETIIANIVAREPEAPLSLGLVLALLPHVEKIPQIGQHVVRHLLSLDPAVVRFVLSLSGAKPFLPKSFSVSSPLMSSIDPSYLFQIVASFISDADLDHLDPVHLVALSCCLETQMTITNETLDRWIGGFNDVVDHLYVSLCDPVVHGAAFDVLRFLLLEVRPQAVQFGDNSMAQSLETMSSVLKMLNEPGASEECFAGGMKLLTMLLSHADDDLLRALRSKTVASMPHELMLVPAVKAWVEDVEAQVADRER
ncbi:hypothetical protein J8273_0077 [Carpediemonas membranifera]|uniref:Calponin-homology (CH) domain-containing protein n=1 Tax=Carpediemonas membranifera TaxID=201153 RepID=A0A8J6EAL6_9EUKA|nr:hypothetical protein J8273_0077 [Carpediemonas membranifera]|eukprot:KAG9394870.1 hypothetical protein J8273_0077 [Carpediemonas membranifera]